MKIVNLDGFLSLSLSTIPISKWREIYRSKRFELLSFKIIITIYYI